MQVSLVEQFESLWESEDGSPDVFEFLQSHSGLSTADRLAVLIRDQRRRWQTDAPLKVEDYLEQLPELGADIESKLQLAVAEFQARLRGDMSLDINEFTSRFEEISHTLRPRLEDVLFTTVSQDSSVHERLIGRYRIARLLGEGAFGVVWLAFDTELHRQVAVKVPTADRFRKPEDAESYLAEARMVAKLDHPNIVPVHDVGRSDDGSVYVVSRFIEGGTLRSRIKRDRPAFDESANLIAICAMALHDAHQKRIVHRDVKPDNILIDQDSGTPYVADFGLAIRQEDFVKQSGPAGTPAYMSPEQALGEGHRIDGRSDVFSLGVILYELLTGQLPFRGGTVNELFHEIVAVDPKPPQDLDASVPSELQRICLRALAKQASDRYPTAADFAEDLDRWCQNSEERHGARAVNRSLLEAQGTESRGTDEAQQKFFESRTDYDAEHRVGSGGLTVPVFRQRSVSWTWISVAILACISGVGVLAISGTSNPEREGFARNDAEAARNRLEAADNEDFSPIVADPDFSAESNPSQSYGVVRRLNGHELYIRQLVFLNDQFLVSSAADGTVRQWDISTGKEVRRLYEGDGAFSSLTLSSSGQHLYGANSDGRILRWDVTTGEVVRTISTEFAGALQHVDVSSQEDYILYRGKIDGRVAVYVKDLRTGKVVREIHQGVQDGFEITRRLTDIRFNPKWNGEYFLAADLDHLYYWNIDSGRPGRLNLMGRKRFVFTPDGRKILSGDSSGESVLFQAISGGGSLIPTEFETFEGFVRSLAMSKSGSIAAGGIHDGSAHVWDLTELRTLLILQGPNYLTNQVALSPNDRLLAIGGGENLLSKEIAGDFNIRIWKLPAKRPDN